MKKFLLVGLWRDKSRSSLPVLVVAIGVTLTVFMHAYITGFMGDTIEMNARFTYGHVKVMSRAYAELSEQMPNDLALASSSDWLSQLETGFPLMEWSERIHFGGLIDVPDSDGETKAQGPVAGFAYQLLGKEANEMKRLGLDKSIVRGKLPVKQGEALLSEHFAQKLGIEPGDTFTLMGSTMNGGMAFYNLILAGTIRFGVDVMDRGSVILDIADARNALEMSDFTGEIVGFSKEGFYNDEQAMLMAARFNEQQSTTGDVYAPVMKALSQQGSMAMYVKMSEMWSLYVSLVFIFAMSLVLWNAGLLGGLRRYGEIGLRIAIGEEKRQVYFSMIYESILIGFAGTVIGTFTGLFFAWLLQTYGLDISGMMKGASLMMPGVIKARITMVDFYLGFFPGMLSTILGTALSGIGIFKRQTASLFKELET